MQGSKKTRIIWDFSAFLPSDRHYRNVYNNNFFLERTTQIWHHINASVCYIYVFKSEMEIKKKSLMWFWVRIMQAFRKFTELFLLSDFWDFLKHPTRNFIEPSQNSTLTSSHGRTKAFFSLKLSIIFSYPTPFGLTNHGHRSHSLEFHLKDHLLIFLCLSPDLKSQSIHSYVDTSTYIVSWVIIRLSYV